jgi:hypothetical protein
MGKHWIWIFLTASFLLVTQWLVAQDKYDRAAKTKTIFELKTNNNAPIFYRLSNKKIRSDIVSGRLPIFQTGEYVLEVFVGTDYDPEKPDITTPINLPKGKEVVLVYNMEKEKLVVRKAEKAGKKKKKQYLDDLDESLARQDSTADSAAQALTKPKVERPKYKPVADAKFDEIMAELNGYSVEQANYKHIRNKISANFFTAVQIRRMLETLDQDDLKLELAKSAYHKCVDKRNYIEVFKVFESNYAKYQLHVAIGSNVR